MATIDQTLTELRTRISQATQKRARYAVEHDQATQRLNAAQQALKDEFGVSTTDEAKATLVRLRAAVDDAIGEATHALNAANA